ncbi:SLIT-ROBO Rho GTPase-activating protein 3-like isoform X2 [Amphibalanus amphitrite]|uniref:SLIT-ROBO Rho GTPase-activating protein 3-like isoform X2 n=1 Tax=Amphibalanus amphitrite TaxID=1232801 RepID=UPI001C917052|nr:SLIT-ROBO Rho GTPase-activating protein 3-like isoform X2 [Amphibalanus amphitrite]
MREPRSERGRHSSGSSLFQCIAPPKNNWSHVLMTADLRLQLNEQLRSLDLRVDTQTAVVAELQEYFRRRAEVELEYSRSLDKLNKSLSQRHKDLKQKREQMHLFSSYSCWQLLMNQTRQESRERAALSDVYANVITNKLSRISDDLQRIYKRCRQICSESHEELLKVLHELQVSTKTYNMYYTQFSNAENKLQYVENQRGKLELSIPKEKLEKSRKFKLVEKEILKRRHKYQDTRLKALQARNDFLLALEAANAAVHRYFADDLSDIMDCMDVGFHTGIARALLMTISAQECVMAGQKAGIDGLHKTITGLDSRLDKQKFIEANNNPFMLPKKFEFTPHRGDQTSRYEVDPEIQEETQKRYDALCRRITSLRTSTEEVWKTMETAERSLVAMVATDEMDVRSLFRPTGAQRTSDVALAKLRANHEETEQFYMTKFAEYIGESNLIARLQAKYEILRAGLGEHTTQLNRLSRSICEKPRRKRIGRAPASGQPRLFGGSLEEYLELSGQEIPLIVRSSVRVINLFGLHHQGIFRVSGSQVEINNFRDSFERGEDPLADVTDASDINSVAGVLKLYLRELREPFFPTLYFDQFMEIAQLRSADEMTARIREVVASLPRPVFVVMRYLFAFLNHLSEFSDENMMEPYNLAICFGPTLLPIPEDKDQVQYQNLVNELMKHIILCHEEIFPRDGGPVYEKYISKGLDEQEDIGEAPSEIASTVDDPDLELPSEDESEQLEAVAQFDFTARSPRELSFHCGDVLTLYRQVSSDWWRGHFRGRDGLVPDKYIMLKIRDEDRSSMSDSSSQPRASVSSECPSAVPAAASTPAPPSTPSSTGSGPAPEPPDVAEPPPEGVRRPVRGGTLPPADPSPPLPLAASLSLPPAAGRRPSRPALQHSVSSGGSGAGRPGHADPAAADPAPADAPAAETNGEEDAAAAAPAEEVTVTSGEVTVKVAAGAEPSPEQQQEHTFGAVTEVAVVPAEEEGPAQEETPETVGPAAPQPGTPVDDLPVTPAAGDSPSAGDMSVTSGHGSGQSGDLSADLSLSGVSGTTDTPSGLSTSDLGHSDDPDPETGTGELDQAMRQIELVTETLRAAELSGDAAVTAGSSPERAEQAAAGRGGRAPVCAAWESRRQPPPLPDSSASVRSRRALWETLSAGGPRERTSSGESSGSSASSVSPAPLAVRQRGPKHTPDLVMDLPPESQRPARGSPPDAASTAAETFARQNQCTLRRSGHTSPGTARQAAGGTERESALAPPPGAVPVEPPVVPAGVSSFKPRVKVKPQVAQKPKLSPEMLKKLTDA